MSTKPTTCSLYNRARAFYAKGFDAYGRFVARYPFPFIIIPILACGLLGLGLLKIEYEVEVERLYTPINSRAAQDRERVKAIFPDQTAENFNTYRLNVEDRYGQVMIIADDIFSDDVIMEVRELVNDIRKIQVVIDGTSLTYNDLCAWANGKCVISGQDLLADDFLSELKLGRVTYPKWNDKDISFTVGKANTVGSTLVTASIVKLSFHLRQDTDAHTQVALLWEDEFLKVMKNRTLKTAKMDFAISQSLGDELNDNTNGDVFWFSLSFTLLITYASITVSGGGCVGGTSHLARAGVIGAGLSILGSLGLISLCGVRFVNIVGIMPFLVLAIGVDDMFLMLSAWGETNQYGKDIPMRVGLAFRLAGVGITITSLTDFCAFAIGYTSVFLSVKNFCIYTGTAIFFCYLIQVTFFAGCLALHGRRVESSRHCITCMKISPKDPDQNKGCLFNCCCTGEPPRTRTDSFLQRFLPLLLNKYLLTLPGKVITLVMFAGYLGVSIWGITRLEEGLILNNLIPPSSYYNTFLHTNYEYFGARIPVAFVFDKEIDYSLQSSLSEIDQLFEEIKQDPVFANETEICWLHYYRSSVFFSATTMSTFVQNLDKFLFHAPEFLNDVIIDRDREVITASRCYFLSINVPDSMDQADLMVRSRALADKSPLPVFAYYPMYIYFEQFVSVLPTILQTVGIAVAVMVFITMVLLPHPLIVALVFINIVLIVIGVFGFMAFWGLSLSSITMIHLIMSVGFSVDFTVHVCSAYMLAEGETRNDRARNAVVHAAGPVFNAGISTFLGIVTLIASQSYVFLSFFRIMVLVVLFGLSTAVLFLPVVLSLIGPVHVSATDTKDSRTDSSTSISTVSMSKDNNGQSIPLAVQFTCSELPNKVMIKM